MPSSTSFSDPAAVPPRSPVELADFDVVDHVVRGEPEMFEIIVRRYNPELYRLGMVYLRNHAQTEDAMQNAYLKAFVGLGRFQRTAAFATWLARIMINECLMMLRSQKRFVTEVIDDEALPARFHPLATPPDDPIHLREIKVLLEQSLAELPLTHRAVYVLREVQHLSTADTAARLGMSLDNVKVCLHRARRGLKASLLKTAEAVELFDYPAIFCSPMTAKVMQAVLKTCVATQ